MKTLKDLLKIGALGFFVGMGVASAYTFKNKPINYICAGTAIAGTCALILTSKSKKNYHTRIYKDVPQDYNSRDKSKDILN